MSKSLREKFSETFAGLRHGGGDPQPGSSTDPQPGSSTPPGLKEKLAGKFAGLRHGGGKNQPGSSTAPATTDTTKPDINAKNFVNKVIALANGEASGDEHIRQLVGLIGPAIFSIEVSGSEQKVYMVDFQDGNKVRFRPERQNPDSKYRIPFSLIVSTISSDRLDMSVTDGELESITFRIGQYQVLNLAAAPSGNCQFVFTTQLSGCTFAVGCIGTKLYMGHAQQSPKAQFATNGLEVGQSLQSKRKTMFQNVQNLESTFFFSMGEEFKIEESRITYSPVTYANVIGLVSNRKIYFVLATKLGSSGTIENVVLVTQETGTTKWITKNYPKTW